jgi:hypothetical protein
METSVITNIHQFTYTKIKLNCKSKQVHIPKIPLGTDVWANAEVHVEYSLVHHRSSTAHGQTTEDLGGGTTRRGLATFLHSSAEADAANNGCSSMA